MEEGALRLWSISDTAQVADCSCGAAMNVTNMDRADSLCQLGLDMLVCMEVHMAGVMTVPNRIAA